MRRSRSANETINILGLDMRGKFKRSRCVTKTKEKKESTGSAHVSWRVAASNVDFANDALLRYLFLILDHRYHTVFFRTRFSSNVQNARSHEKIARVTSARLVLSRLVFASFHREQPRCKLNGCCKTKSTVIVKLSAYE